MDSLHTWLINHKSHLCILTMISCDGAMAVVDLQPAGPPVGRRVVVFDWGYMRTSLYHFCFSLE